MKTIVCNLYSGPGAGKSTLAAQLFAEFKKQNKSVELVHEWVKSWAWEGRVPKGYQDNIYIFSKQLKAESTVYGKVDFVITDSPLGLSPVYEKLYSPWSNIMRGLFAGVMEEQMRGGVVEHINMHLLRKHAYVNSGRFEDEETARKVDSLCREMHSGYEIDGLEGAVSLMKKLGYLQG